MARKAKQKGKAGDAVNYITRAQALKKLQLSLADFRRLCILKGVYPRDPKKKVKGKDKTYYALKDILFIMHEPVLEKLREIRAHKNKMIKAKSKKDNFKVELLEKHKAFYLLDRLVKVVRLIAKRLRAMRLAFSGTKNVCCASSLGLGQEIAAALPDLAITVACVSRLSVAA